MIWFNVREAYDYLMAHSEVFSVRSHKKKNEGKMMLLSTLEGKPHYKGIVDVTFCKEINLENPISKSMLFNYVRKSGFKTVEQWLMKASKAKVLYLYHVKLLHGLRLVPRDECI